MGVAVNANPIMYAATWQVPHWLLYLLVCWMMTTKHDQFPETQQTTW